MAKTVKKTVPKIADPAGDATATAPKKKTRACCAAQPAPTRPARPVMPTDEQIRARAYQIYLSRGCGPGDPSADWAQAERELIDELSR